MRKIRSTSVTSAVTATAVKKRTIPPGTKGKTTKEIWDKGTDTVTALVVQPNPPPAQGDRGAEGEPITYDSNTGEMGFPNGGTVYEVL